MSTLYTIGYGGRSPAKVAALLKDHAVTTLIDVRASPRSRIPAFNKGPLARSMMAEGIAYHHVEALGNVNRNAGPGAPVVLVDEASGLAALRDLLSQGDVAIMCACRLPDNCHRRYVSDLMPQAEPNLTIVDL